MSETSERKEKVADRETEGGTGARRRLQTSSSQNNLPTESDFSQESMQEKVILYQILQKHMESLGQNAALLERRYEEMEMTRQALEDIGRLKEKNDILIPVGSGFFTRGKISDSQSMLVDIGAGVFMDKDTDSSKSILEDRRKEIEALANEMQHEMNEVSSRINSLAMEIEQASQQAEHEHEHTGKGHPRKEEDSGRK